MLAESPGALLAALDEALSAYLLMVRADGLAFRHEFIRQAVARMLAEPIQQALHRQFGQMLLARGGSAVPAAYHLIRGARPGDAQALAALGVARWDSGRITEALDLAATAVRQATERPYETTYFSPHLLLASALVYVRRLDEATAITNSVESLEAAVTSPWPEGTTEILRARIALAAGRLDDADALAQSALRSMQASAPGAGDSLAVPVLATVALRRGDLAAAAEYGQRLSAIGRYYGSPYLADGICLVAAQVLEAWRGPRAALDFLAEALAGLPEHRSVLLADPASAPWLLVRAALAAGDRALAARIVSAINDTARDNPTLAVIRASAEHAEGLLAGDVPACSMRPTSWRTLGPAPAR